MILAFWPTILWRNMELRNDRTFWCGESEHYPKAPDANAHCGFVLAKAGDLQGALSHYNAALDVRIEPQWFNDYAVTLLSG